MPQTFDTSIVIPAYNEAIRLPNTLKALAALCRTSQLGPVVVKEVIVVDDGSLDQTMEVVRTLNASLPSLTILRSLRNFGKGHAVRIGIAHAQFPWVLVADADMSTPWTEVIHLAHNCLRESADISIASRDVVGSKIIQHQSFVREYLGKAFNIFLRGLTGLSFKDTQCGFKLIRRERVERFLQLLTVNRFAWDVEFLIYARTFNIRTVEVPVQWQHKEDSRVHIIRDGLEMVFSVLKIRTKFFVKNAYAGILRLLFSSQ